ncbi:MAG: exopolysaccharide Pel transporter PelG [Planctomycetota bacterium]
MAGIGFTLERLMNKGTFKGFAQAYVFSAVVSTGPWLLSTLCLAFLSALAPESLSHELVKFRTVVTYSYMGSLVFAGFWQMVITRLIADRLYVSDTEAMAPGFLTSGVLVALISSLIAGTAVSYMHEPLTVRIFAASIFIFVCLIWHVMIFLSAASGYFAIIRAFLIGSLMGVMGCIVLGHYYGLTGYMAGFALGQASIWAFLAVRLLVEFPSNKLLSIDVFRSFSKYPIHILVGGFYNLGIWIDKLVFWSSPVATVSIGLLPTFPTYDRALFIAYLSIVPTFTVFLITVETNFARRFNDFFTAVLTQRSLPEIQFCHEAMGKALDDGITRLLKVQGAVSLIAMACSEQIAHLTGLPPESIGILRVSFLAVFLHAIFLVLLLIVLYLDVRKVALFLTALFCLLNGLLTVATYHLGPATFGYGYVFASLISTLTAYVMLKRRYGDMIWRTFNSIDIPEPAVDDV